jgi:membrane protease YdiL (CAAX protease family)
VIDATTLTRRVGAPSLRAISAYLGAIAAAELLTAFVNAEAGMAVHAVLLLTLLNHAMALGPIPTPPAGRMSTEPARVLVPVLALLPLVRFFSLTMPTRSVSPLFWFLLIGVPLLTAVVLMVRYIRYSPVDARIWGWSLQQGLIGATGIPLGIIAYVLFHRVPTVASQEIPYLIIGAGILLVFLGLLEELIFRALLQPYLCSLYGATRGVLLTAAISAVFSSGSRSPVTMLFTFVVAVCYGWLVYTNRSIMGVAISHGVIGIMTILLLPNV